MRNRRSVPRAVARATSLPIIVHTDVLQRAESKARGAYPNLAAVSLVADSVVAVCDSGSLGR